MIRCVIIDDSKKARDLLRKELELLEDKIDLVGEAANVKEGIALVNSEKPDLLFLDIQMPDGDGFDLLEKVKSRDFGVIFITASDEYAVKAFRFSALDYLLKPIDSDDLEKALKKFKKEKGSDNPLGRLEDALFNFRNKPGRIALHTTEKIIMVSLEEIIRFEADGNYTRVILAGGKTHLQSKTLKEFDDLLSQSGFFRVHQSHLVNTLHIREFVKTDGGYLLLSDQKSVPVSVRKRAEVVQMLENL
jgi:two-component system, LytTR family, response regulator